MDVTSGWNYVRGRLWREDGVGGWREVRPFLNETKGPGGGGVWSQGGVGCYWVPEVSEGGEGLKSKALEILKGEDIVHELGERERDGNWRYVKSGVVDEERWKAWRFKVAGCKRDLEVI